MRYTKPKLLRTNGLRIQISSLDKLWPENISPKANSFIHTNSLLSEFLIHTHHCHAGQQYGLASVLFCPACWRLHFEIEGTLQRPHDHSYRPHTALWLHLQPGCWDLHLIELRCITSQSNNEIERKMTVKWKMLPFFKSMRSASTFPLWAATKIGVIPYMLGMLTLAPAFTSISQISTLFLQTLSWRAVQPWIQFLFTEAP